MVMGPALLLADEPTGALDTAAGQDVSKLLTGLNAEGQTIVVVTHDLALAQSCTKRTVRIADGRITEDVRSPAVASQSVSSEAVR
jgi:putative ABC transport system ATP-binding protein